MQRTIAFVISIFIFAACANETLSPSSAENVRCLTAVAPSLLAQTGTESPDQTRTALSGVTPLWCEGDSIWLSNGQKTVCIELGKDDLLPDGKFSIQVEDMPGTIYAVYPASCVAGMTGSSIRITYPECCDGSFGSAHIAVASVTEGEETLSFRNVGSVLRLKLDPDNAQRIQRVRLLCPGIAGEFACPLEDLSSLEQSGATLLNGITVNTSGRQECYVGIPPMSMAAGTEFIFEDGQQNTVFTRTSSKENVFQRNRLVNLSFLKEEVRLVQSSVLDPLWHEGDSLTLTDGENVQQIEIQASDIAPDGSVTVSTQLLVQDGRLKAVCPSSCFKGTDSGKVIVEIPRSQDGTAECADITWAECEDGVLTFSNYAPVAKLSGLPGAAKSLTLDDGCGEFTLALDRRRSRDYYLAYTPGSSKGAVRYFGENGSAIGSAVLNLSSSAGSLTLLDNLRQTSSVDLGDGYCNWLGYFPDDAMIPDLIMTGTHDAGTYGYDGILKGQVKCQDIDFSAQLKNGVRCFDIRLSENMNIFHGSFYCNVGLRTFLDQAFAFLSKYPRETVFCFVKDENCEGDGPVWNQHFQEIIDSYGRDRFVIERGLVRYELGRFRGKVVIITRSRSEGSFGYLDGAPSINFPDDTWTKCTSGGDITVALEDSYSADKGNPKKKEITDFLSAVSADGGYLLNGHRTRWIITYTSGYNGYTFGIPWPEDFCDDLLKVDIINTLQTDYDSLSREGITFFHDFIEKWDSYTAHLFNMFVRKE